MTLAKPGIQQTQYNACLEGLKNTEGAKSVPKPQRTGDTSQRKARQYGTECGKIGLCRFIRVILGEPRNQVCSVLSRHMKILPLRWSELEVRSQGAHTDWPRYWYFHNNNDNTRLLYYFIQCSQLLVRRAWLSLTAPTLQTRTPRHRGESVDGAGFWQGLHGPLESPGPGAASLLQGASCLTCPGTAPSWGPELL